jgi:hypothetical protein
MAKTEYRIHIIESFDGINDPKVGHNLYNEILKIIKASNCKTKIRYFDVNTSQQLFNSLNTIKKNCEENDTSPVIHFCMHGNKNGLVLKNNDLIKYAELSEILSEINEAAHGELLLIMDACRGNNLTLWLNPYLTCPFLSVFGSNKAIGMWEPLKGFMGFYKALIRTSRWGYAVRQFKVNCPDDQSSFRFLSDHTVLKNTRYKRFKPYKIDQE